MKFLYYQFILFCGLLFQHVYSQTMIPGECLLGQMDDRKHDASEYSPVLYSYAPSTYKAQSNNSYLVFMSFNIQSTYSLFCAEVLSDQTALIASINPDFVGLQETDIDVDIRCNCNIPKTVADATGHTGYFMMMFPYRNGKYGDSTSLGYTVYDLKYLYFNVSNNYFEQRGAIAHLVQPTQLGGWKMWYVNTHLEQSSLDIRKIQVSQLISWVNGVLQVQEPEAVVVMTGDFYTVPGDGSYEEMATFFTNAWAVHNNGSPAGGFTHPSDAPTERYDHIWFRETASKNVEVEIKSFTIISSLLSDHLPIYANISFKLNSLPPTVTPTVTPTETPTITPSSSPSSSPSGTPTDTPTDIPSNPTSSANPTTSSTLSPSSPSSSPSTSSEETTAHSTSLASTITYSSFVALFILFSL